MDGLRTGLFDVYDYDGVLVLWLYPHSFSGLERRAFLMKRKAFSLVPWG